MEQQIEQPKEKKEIIFTPEQERVLQEFDKTIEIVNTEKTKLLTRIEEQDKPAKVDRAFLRSDKLLDKIKWRVLNTPLPLITELKEPILVLMKNNGYTDIIENIRAGDFLIATPKGEKSISLTPDKLTTIKYNNQYFRGWISYEDCMSPYPENPIHSAEMYRKTTQKLAMNWRDRDDTAVITAKTRMWLWIIGGIVGAVILLMSTPFGKELITNLGKPAVQPVAQTIQQQATQTTATAGTITVN